MESCNTNVIVPIMRVISLRALNRVLCTMLSVILIVLLVLAPAATQPLNILLVSAPAAGHLTPLARLGQELVHRGHRVSLCSTVIDGWDFAKEIAHKYEVDFLNAGQDPRNKSEYSSLTESLRGAPVYRSLLVAQSVLAHSESVLLNFLDKPAFKEWNIVIFDFVLEGSGSYLSEKWGTQIVINSPGLAYSPLLLPEWPFPVIGSGTSYDMTFTQRFYQTVFILPMAYALKLSLILTTKLTVGWYKSPPLSSSLFCGAGLRYPLLINTVLGFEYPRPYSPITHYVGPLISIQTDNSDLIPEDVTEWLDSRDVSETEGVVLISMGSTAHLTHTMIRTISHALYQTNFSGIWSTGSTNASLFLDIDVSIIKVVTWIPQRLVLQHSSVKIAILHGGINGVQEALTNCVPVICLPQMFDQHANAERLVFHHLGLAINPLSMTTEQLVNALNVIKSDYNVFKNSARMLSLLFQTSGGVDSAAGIIEYYESVGLIEGQDCCSCLFTCGFWLSVLLFIPVLIVCFVVYP